MIVTCTPKSLTSLATLSRMPSTDTCCRSSRPAGHGHQPANRTDCEHVPSTTLAHEWEYRLHGGGHPEHAYGELRPQLGQWRFFEHSLVSTSGVRD